MNSKACFWASVLPNYPPCYCTVIQCSIVLFRCGRSCRVWATDPGFPCKTSKRSHLQHYLSCSDLLHQRLSFPPKPITRFPNFCPDLFKFPLSLSCLSIASHLDSWWNLFSKRTFKRVQQWSCKFKQALKIHEYTWSSSSEEVGQVPTDCVYGSQHVNCQHCSMYVIVLAYNRVI